jgi:hypothetical protein
MIRPSILVFSKKLYATALRRDRNYCTRRPNLRLYVCDNDRRNVRGVGHFSTPDLYHPQIVLTTTRRAGESIVRIGR